MASKGEMIKCTSIEFVRAITSTFVLGFQKKVAQLFSLRSNSAIRNICSGTLQVKNTLEGQMIKCSCIQLSRAIASTFMHGFQNNLHSCSP